MVSSSNGFSSCCPSINCTKVDRENNEEHLSGRTEHKKKKNVKNALDSAALEHHRRKMIGKILLLVLQERILKGYNMAGRVRRHTRCSGHHRGYHVVDCSSYLKSEYSVGLERPSRDFLRENCEKRTSLF